MGQIRSDVEASNTFQEWREKTTAILHAIGAKAVIASWEEAKALDLSGYKSVYIESYYANWEDSAAGPLGGAIYHKTDSPTGAPSSGDAVTFYDAGGLEFSLKSDQEVTPYVFGATGSGDDTAAFNLIESSSFDRIKLPEGVTFTTTLNSVAKTYYGKGLIDLNGTVTDYDYFGPDKLLKARDAIIEGDLTVNGTTTTINTQNLDVEDKIIKLNDGEPGAGISGDGLAGFEVDRGSGQDKWKLLFNEAGQTVNVSFDDGVTLEPLATATSAVSRNFISGFRMKNLGFTFPNDDDWVTVFDGECVDSTNTKVIKLEAGSQGTEVATDLPPNTVNAYGGTPEITFADKLDALPNSSEAAIEYAPGNIGYGFCFANSGNSLYTSKDTSKVVEQLDLNTPYDIGSGGTGTSFDFSAQVATNNISGIALNNDGTKVYIVEANGASSAITQWSLSTPYDISTASYDNKSFSAGANVTGSGGVYGMQWDATGDTFYIATRNPGTIYQIEVTTPYDIDTAIFSARRRITTIQDSPTGSSDVRGFTIAPDGKTLYVTTYGNEEILQYFLRTPWDLLSATFYSSVSISSLFSTATDPVDIANAALSDDGVYFYVVSMGTDRLYQLRHSDVGPSSSNFIGRTQPGARQNTWYGVFALTDEATSKTRIGFDIEEDASNLLADPWIVGEGYLYYRRVGWIYLDVAENVERFIQYPNGVFKWGTYKEEVFHSNGSTEWAANNNEPMVFELAAAPNSFADVHMKARSDASTIVDVVWGDLNQTTPDPSSLVGGRGMLTVSRGVPSQVDVQFNQVSTTVKTTAGSRIQASKSTQTFFVQSLGWIDDRGTD